METNWCCSNYGRRKIHQRSQPPTIWQTQLQDITRWPNATSNFVNYTNDRFKSENLLTKKLADGLKSINPKPPKFYISPKIHKENNPGRPMINLINCHTSEISRFVDHHLQPFVREISSNVKDTNDFLNEINNFPVPPNSLTLLQWTSSQYTQVLLITKGLLQWKRNMIIIQNRPYLLRL